MSTQHGGARLGGRFHFAIAFFGTSSRLGLGAVWAKSPFVQKHRSLA